MVKLFYSYSHRDEELKNELIAHLSLLSRQNIISSWHDRLIDVGSDIDKNISAELESSHIILLLISAHFIASDYCYETEMTKAIDKHKDGSAIVIPVILHPCDWQSAPFGKLKATPTDGKPVSDFDNQQKAFTIIAKDIRKAAEKFKISTSIKENNIKSVGDYFDAEHSNNLKIKKEFSDHERDEFLEKCFKYISNYFEASLKKLEEQNPHIDTKYKNINELGFIASVYSNGNKVAHCNIYYGRDFFTNGIAYSNSESISGGSYNELLNINDDGYSLFLKPLGMQMFTMQNDDNLSKKEAAEYFWSILIKPLQ